VIKCAIPGGIPGQGSTADNPGTRTIRELNAEVVGREDPAGTGENHHHREVVWIHDVSCPADLQLSQSPFEPDFLLQFGLELAIKTKD